MHTVPHRRFTHRTVVIGDGGDRSTPRCSIAGKRRGSNVHNRRARSGGSSGALIRKPTASSVCSFIGTHDDATVHRNGVADDVASSDVTGAGLQVQASPGSIRRIVVNVGVVAYVNVRPTTTRDATAHTNAHGTA